MKLLIIANGYPNKHDPQWGCFEKDQAVALKNLGHEVCIMYVDRRFRTYWRKIGLTSFIDNGIAVFGIFWFPMLGLKYLMPKYYFYLVKQMLEKVFNSVLKHWGKPDIIYAHYLYNIAFATELKEKYGIPLVGIEHWSELTKSKLRPLHRFWGETAYSKADKILAVSNSLRSHIKRHFSKDSTVVYDMLGQEFVTAPVPEHTLNANFTFVAVGSLVPIKCYDILVEAFKQSGLFRSGCKVVIVGAGPEYAKLKRYNTPICRIMFCWQEGKIKKKSFLYWQRAMLSFCHRKLRLSVWHVLKLFLKDCLVLLQVVAVRRSLSTKVTAC